MRTGSRLHRLILSGLAFLGVLPLAAQELEPGAYSVSPVGVNIVVLNNTISGGDVAFDPTLPIEEAKASINASAVGYVRTLNIGGRSANVGVVAPYVVGNLEGIYIGEFRKVRRSGVGDPRVRFAVNLYGAPAMNLKEFAGYRQKTNIGASVTVVAPLGQYDPNSLINIGANRWAFKPELGLSRAIGKWTLEFYGGAWVFTQNNRFFGGKTRKQQPIGSGQFHILYTFKPRLWAALDATFYTGGRTSVDGARNLDLQRNSRVGGTLSIPIARRQSLRFAFSRGAYTTVGADFSSLSVAYQFLWGGGL